MKVVDATSDAHCATDGGFGDHGGMDAAVVMDALATLPANERQAVAEHVRRLVKLPVAKRAAVMVLAQ